MRRPRQKQHNASSEVSSCHLQKLHCHHPRPEAKLGPASLILEGLLHALVVGLLHAILHLAVVVRAHQSGAVSKGARLTDKVRPV
eukprot:13877957-Alexandrium_andersonii.AAC.1